MEEIQQDLEILEKLTRSKEEFFKKINKVIIGQREILDQILIALLAVSLLTFLKSFLSATRFQILNRSLSMYLIGIGLFWFVSRSF